MAPKPLNYTTTVDAERSFAEIRKILISHGARQIASDHDDAGRPTAVSFAIAGRAGLDLDLYRLPANADRVLGKLQQLRQAGDLQPRYVNAEQATRIAWRVLKDWIESQLALIQLGMRDIEEVLLPYQLQDGRTVYEHHVERKQLDGPPVERKQLDGPSI